MLQLKSFVIIKHQASAMLSNSKLLISVLLLTLLPLTSSQRQYVTLQNYTLSFSANALAFTDDRKYLAVGGPSGVLQVLNIEGEKVSFHSELANDASLGNLAWIEFSSEGAWLVSCTYNGNILIFRRNETTDEYDKMQEITATTEIDSCSISADHQYLGFMDNSTGFIHKFNSDTSLFEAYLNVTLANITYIDFTSNGGYIILIGESEIKLYTNDGMDLTEFQTFPLKGKVSFGKVYLQDEMKFLVLPDYDPSNGKHYMNLYKYDNSLGQFVSEASEIFNTFFSHAMTADG